MHLVCFVLGTSNLDTMTDKRRSQINDIKSCVNKKGLPMVVVVTKFDEFSEKLLEDASQVYRCMEAHDAIKRVSDFFGIQEKYIFPIVNYINDNEIKEGKDMLALQALDVMVRLTNDYLEMHKEKTSKVESWAERANKLLIRRLIEEKHAVLTNLWKEMTALGDNTLRILCVGAVNSGKTSFVDSILSTLRDEIYSKASGGYATGGNSELSNNVSTTEEMYRFRYKQKLEEEDKLCSSSVFIGDLPGFQENLGIQLEAVKYVVQGHVPNSYKIKYGISRDSAKFKKHPEKKDKVKCVCFIFDISTPADELPGKIQEALKNLQRWLLGKKIPYIVILTKCDLLNAEIGEGKYQVFENNTLKENKDKLIKMFGFKQSKMFPVVNYIHEDTVVPESDALLIAALKEILKLGKEYFEDSDDKVTDESDNEEKGSDDCETNKANSWLIDIFKSLF
ncbi:interferon-induced protein 44-like [Mercenaria mercenaria]|uniref:interferon-induced protein 44-like n=1 Tax=Mercenaria mercenaria TaxID=6596 RepID=UPI00234F949C|nr:interferon-induced protein 44-like [Mercenaria mercenaria]